MKKLADVLKDRLKNIVVCDREELSQNAVNMIKIDIIKALEGYFDLDRDSFFLNCNIDEDGKYLLNISTTAKKIKKVGVNIKPTRKYII